MDEIAENKKLISQEEKQELPTQKELERELSDYLSRKYGDRIKIITPFVFPKGEIQEAQTSPKGPKGIASKINFNMKPEELEAYLDEYVVRQDEAKAVLATKICTHFNRIKYWEQQDGLAESHVVGMIKNNIIMLGPTGVGKTYLIKLIAKKLGVPFVKGDATKFSETGYVGGDVEDLIRDLVYEANDDIELAQYGIVYIDEIDKIASSNNLIGPDVSRTGVQRALLKPMEETEVDLRVPHDPISQLQAIENFRKSGKKEKRTVNTRNILFIVSGAFNNLDKIVQKRVQEQGIGFRSSLKSKKQAKKMLNQVRAEDLIAYGFESEFVGRLPVAVVLEELSEEDLFQILKNPNNPIIRSKKRDFKSYGIDIFFEEEALRLLAQRAYEEKTGARGLVSVVEKALIKFEKKLPSLTIPQFLVTPEVVLDPPKGLEALLNDPENFFYKSRFQEAWNKEFQALKGKLLEKETELTGRFNGPLTEFRTEMIARRSLELVQDLSQAYEEVWQMIRQVQEYELRFFERVGISLKFSEDGIDAVLQKALDSKVSVWSICESLSKDFEYGFKLVREKTAMTRFVITPEAISNAEGYIQKLIRTYYQAGESGSTRT
ncbi:MAG: ATPase [Desulfobacca sp.]|nr:ATPase [Desulfobacca sp.]